MRLVLTTRILPIRSQDVCLQQRLPLVCRRGVFVNLSARCSSSAAQTDRPELKAKISRLESQIEKQMEMLKLQGDRLEQLTKMVVTSSGNLLDMHAAKHGTAVSRDRFVPTLDLVADQVNHTMQLNNNTLASLAIVGDSFARKERLIREIMQVDKCSWDEAHEKLIEMDEYNERYYWFETIPYRVGMSAAAFGVIASILLVFHKPTAKLYATEVAGEDLPEDKDITTMTTNQVGAWTWEWMEPMIGVASFVILCLQCARSQMLKLRMSAYTAWMLKNRADRLTQQYPQYTGAIVRAWAIMLPRVSFSFFPAWKRVNYTAEHRRKNFRTGVSW